MRLWLIRHAQSTWNAERRAQGWADPPLSALGLRQAEAVGCYFSDKPLHALYCSSLLRARQTAAPIAGVTGLAPVPDERLKERNLGEATGMTWGHWDEILKPQAEGRAALERGEPVWSYIPGAESQDVFLARITLAMNEIVDKHSGEDVAVVSHGGVLSAYLRWLATSDISADGYSFHNAAVSLVHFNGDGHTEIQFINDSQHLHFLDAGIASG